MKQNNILDNHLVILDDIRWTDPILSLDNFFIVNANITAIVCQLSSQLVLCSIEQE